MNLSNIERDRIYIWVTQTIINIEGNLEKLFPFKSVYRLLYYNPIMINLIIQDTHNALDRYFESMKNVGHTQNKLADPLWTSDRDIVIHFRCGDVLSERKTTYGFVTSLYFQRAFEIISELYGTNSLFEDTPNITIWFLSQLGKNSLRRTMNQERKNANGCNQLVYGYVKELQKMVSPATIVINGNDLLSVDFYRMVYAPNLICSMSSFCESAALANANNVIMPIYGPWWKLPEMIEGGIWYPPNHHIINNSEEYMILSSFNISSKQMNVSQITEYLISH